MKPKLFEKFLIVIQARMGSKRFPGKVLEKLDGVSLLENQINLLKSYNFKNIIIATSDKSIDDPIMQLSTSIGVKCTRGSEHNVFDRYQKLSKQYSDFNIIRLTGDNPIVSKTILFEAISSHLATKADFTSTRSIKGEQVHRYISKGWSVDIMSSEPLKKVNQDELDNFDKEHVIPVYYRSSFKINLLTCFQGLELENVSIDYPKDLKELNNKLETSNIFEYTAKIDGIILKHLNSQRALNEKR